MSSTEGTQAVTEGPPQAPTATEQIIRPKRDRSELQRLALDKARIKAFEVRRCKEEAKAVLRQTEAVVVPQAPVVPSILTELPPTPTPSPAPVQAPPPIEPVQPPAPAQPVIPPKKFKFDNRSGNYILN